MIIENSMYELDPFLMVLYGLICVMAMCSFIVKNDLDHDNHSKKINHFWEVLYDTYTVMFGENPEFKEVKKKN